MGDEAFDREGFYDWLAEDPSHEPLFDTMWRRFMGADTSQALATFVQRKRARRVIAGAAMASVLVLFGAYQAWPSLELFLAQPQTYDTQGGHLREIALADGTRITLAGGADIRVRYTSHAREVELRAGSIFADVRHDANRPFRIIAGDAQIVDLGTRFEVARKPSSLRVTVASGAVRVAMGNWFGKRVDLVADQVAILDQAGLRRGQDVRGVGIARWRSEWAEYRDTPMEQVVADLEAVSPLPIHIVDQDLGNLRVSGRIRLTDPASQVDNLSLMHGFSVERKDDAIVLSRGRAGR